MILDKCIWLVYVDYWILPKTSVLVYMIKHSEFPKTSVLTSVNDKTCAGLDGAGLADTQAGPVGKTSVHLDRHSHHHRHNNHHRHNKFHFSSAIAITTSIVILIFARSLNDQLCENLYVLYNCLYLGDRLWFRIQIYLYLCLELYLCNADTLCVCLQLCKVGWLAWWEQLAAASGPCQGRPRAHTRFSGTNFCICFKVFQHYSVLSFSF